LRDIELGVALELLRPARAHHLHDVLVTVTAGALGDGAVARRDLGF
jgi:hypothetical protein